MRLLHYAYLLLLCACVSGIEAFSQKSTHENDSLRIEALLQSTANLTRKAAYDSAIGAAQKIVTIARQSGNRKGEAQGYDALAEIMLITGRMSQLRTYDSIAAPLRAQLKDTILLINAANRAGVYFLEKGRTKDAEHSFIQALELGPDKQQTSKTAELYSNLASLYLNNGDKDKAIEWFFKALRLYEKNSNENGQGETYSNISSVYYLMGRTEEAINYQKRSIALREKSNDIPGLVITHVNIGQLYILKDSFPRALLHISQAVEYADRINSPRLKGSAYSGMSAYYSRIKDFPLALSWQARAIQLLEETDNKQLLSRLYVAAGNLANVTKDSSKAVMYYTKALGLATQLNNKENISNAYEKLSSFYLSHDDYGNAYQYYRKHISYRDSIASNSTVAKIEEIKTRYETEKKDNEIARLNTEQRIRQLEIEKQKAIIAGNTLEAQQKESEIKLLSQEKKLKDAAYQKQEEELEKQLLVATNTEQQLKLAEQDKLLRERELSAQKQVKNIAIAGAVLLGLLGLILFNRYKLKKRLEQQHQLLHIRNDISRNLHDDIGASLSNINILNELTRRNVKDPEKASAYLLKAGDDIQRISESLSDIVWNINPQYDDLDHLFIRMKRYAADMLDGKNIAAQLVFPIDADKITMPMDQRRDFYLIFKEAVNNLAKYSKATEATIEIKSANEEVQLQVMDNGQGFDVHHTRPGNGIQNMRQRADKWKALLKVDTTPGQGTKILLQMRVGAI